MSTQDHNDQPAPLADLAHHVANHPIETAEDELLLARALAEVIAGKGRRPSGDDRYRFEQYTEQTQTPLLELADAPLMTDDVKHLDVGQRRTMFLIADSVAEADGGADEGQNHALDQLAMTLELSASDVGKLERAGARLARESAAMAAAGAIEGNESEVAADSRHEAFRDDRLQKMHTRHEPRAAPHNVGVFGSTGPGKGPR